MQVSFIEPTLRTLNGHWFGHVLGFARAAQQLGHTTEVYCQCDVDELAASGLRAEGIEVRPLFSDVYMRFKERMSVQWSLETKRLASSFAKVCRRIPADSLLVTATAEYRFLIALVGVLLTRRFRYLSLLHT